MRQKRIDELQDQIDNLRNELNALKSHFDYLNQNFESRVDKNISDKIYVRTVENLEAYKKGKELKRPINAIKEILK